MPDPKNPSPEDAAPATSAPEVRVPRPEPTPPPQGDTAGVGATDPEAPDLGIPIDTVAWIILKAREFDMKEPSDVASTEDDGDNPLGVLEDRADDPTVDELRSWIADLDETGRAELVALMWLGRGDDGAEGFAELVEEARGQQTGDGTGTARYLLGTPQLGDYLEEGLEKLGIETAQLESGLG